MDKCFTALHTVDVNHICIYTSRSDISTPTATSGGNHPITDKKYNALIDHKMSPRLNNKLVEKIPD